MKQRCSFRDGCEGKDKEKRARHRNENHSAFVAFDDIMTDIVKNISTQCTTQPQPTNEAATNATNQNRANPIDPTKQFALNSETFSKAGEVLSNLAQHFVSVMDPFAVHEFIPTTTTTSDYRTQSETNNRPDEQPKVAEENVDKNSNDQPSAAVSIPPSNTPIVPATPVPVETPKERVTIEDVIEAPTSTPRDSSPATDWAVVDSFGHIEEGGDQQPKHTGAIPKTPTAVHTPSSVGSVDAAAAQALPNYAILARDLEDHLHHTLKSQASQTPPQMPIVHHPSKLNVSM